MNFTLRARAPSLRVRDFSESATGPVASFRFTKPNEIIIVPGKVLGSGSLNHSLTVAAFSFSESAREIIEQAKGKCLTIKELVQKNPKAKDVKIIG